MSLFRVGTTCFPGYPSCAHAQRGQPRPPTNSLSTMFLPQDWVCYYYLGIAKCYLLLTFSCIYYDVNFSFSWKAQTVLCFPVSLHPSRRCFCSVWPCPAPPFFFITAPTPGFSHHFWGYCSPHSIAGHFALSSAFLKSSRKHDGNNHWGSHCCSQARASTVRSFT